MGIAVFVVVAALYAIASGLYLAFAARGSTLAARWGAITLGVAATTHVVWLGYELVRAGRLELDIEGALAITSLLVTIVYLIALRRGRLQVLGAFVGPITLSLFLGAGVSHEVGAVPAGARSVLIWTHVSANVIGIAAFALAFGTAVAYVIQERLLREKKVSGLFQRLPPLDTLDALSFRFVVVGFGLFTVGVVTGSFFAVRHAGLAEIDVARVVGILAWLCFATVLALRLVAGWRGRRAAIGAMLGFVCAVVVLIGYALREGGAT